MATVQRPLKEGSVRTYQEKVGLGFVDILASEMDADLDAIYAAWNGGVDSVTLKDGAVTTPKLVDLSVTTAKLAKGATLPAQTNTYNTSAVTAGNNVWDFLGEASLAVDTARPLFIAARIYFDIGRLTAGATGQSFNVYMRYGGTSGAFDGTAVGSEEFATIAQAAVGEYVTVWYPYFAITAPPATPYLFKMFMNNPNNTLYALRKRALQIWLWQPA